MGDNFYLRFFNPYNDPDWVYGVTSKSTLETKILENDGFRNDIDGGLPFFPKRVLNDNSFLSWVKAYELREHVLKNSNAAEMRRLYGQKWDDLVKLANSLHDESNDVLIMVKNQK